MPKVKEEEEPQERSQPSWGVEEPPDVEVVDSLVPTRVVLMGHALQQWTEGQEGAQKGQEHLHRAMQHMKCEQLEGENMSDEEEEDLDGEDAAEEEEEEDLGGEEWEDLGLADPSDELLRASLHSTRARRAEEADAREGKKVRKKHPKRTRRRRDRKKNNLASAGRTLQPLNRARSNRRKRAALKKLVPDPVPSNDDTDDTEPLE